MYMYCKYYKCMAIKKKIKKKKVVFSGTVYMREGAQAGRLTDTMGKGNFHVILFKIQGFLC